MRRSRLAVLGVLAIPSFLAGQSYHWPKPAYFGASSLQMLIFGDSTMGVQLWTTFSATSGGFSRTAIFLPGQVLVWVASAESLLAPAPLADTGRWIHPSVLPATNGDALVLGRRPRGKHWDRKADVVYLRRTPAGDSAILDARFEISTARDFLDSLRARALAARGYAPHPESSASGSYDGPAMLRPGHTVYPEALREQGIEGTVIVAAMVDTIGRVDPSSMDVLLAPDSAFARAARTALAETQFRPARRDGVPVRSSIVIPFKFILTVH